MKWPGTLLLAFVMLTPVAAAADHGDPSTREASVGAPYEAKIPAHTETQEIAGHQVALSWFPDPLAPGRLVRFTVAIRQKAGGEAYGGEVTLAVRRPGEPAAAAPLALTAVGDAWSALHVFDAPGPQELAVEFTPLPDPASGALQIEKKTVVFRCDLPGAATNHRQHALYGTAGLGLLLLILSFVIRRRTEPETSAPAAAPPRPRPAAGPTTPK